MGVVVIGGSTKSVGKTSVVVGLIAALSERRWTAIKMEMLGEDHGAAFVVREELERGTGTDSSRYLDAGAVKAYWARVQRERLQEAMAWVQETIAAAENVVIESNSVLEFLEPEVALSVMDLATEDWKTSALRYMGRMDAVVMTGFAEPIAAVERMIADKLRFVSRPPEYCSAELVAFVRERLDARLDVKRVG